MASLMNNRSRAEAALKLVTQLTQEKQRLLQDYRKVSAYERIFIQARLNQIDRELLRAEEERRRARAGAPRR
ncbi:MAG: hypothetical protein HC837_14125, partial [Chloroflexaceae bacterium]|nr:hypothetical protein [Chloroflexaceae bacterium]